MPVYQRKDTESKRFFYKFQIDKVTYKKNVPTARTRRQAEEAERKARDDVHEGRYATQRPTLFSAFVKDSYQPWAEAHNKRHKLDATAAKLFIQHSGDLMLSQISQYTFERFKLLLLRTQTNRNRTYNPTTVNLYLHRIARMLSLAVEWGFLSKTPVGNLEMAPVLLSKPRFLQKAEQAALLESLAREPSFMLAICRAALLTGFRLIELINLRRQDVNPSLGLIFVRDPKWRNDPRKFEGNPLSRDASELFSALISEGSIDRVFQYQGKPLTRDMVMKGFRSAADRAGLPDLTFHKLRHTFGTRLGEQNFNQKQIARLMGHASTRYTDQYVHSSDLGLRAAVEAVAAESRALSTQIVPEKEVVKAANVA